MFEAKLEKAALMKKLVESIKDLITDAPFDCSEGAMCLQAMDSSHVALVSLKLGVGLFETYRCDRTLNLGLSMAQLSRALKCAGNDDTCLMRYDDDEGDSVLFSFTDEKKNRKQDITVKLLDIDAEHLGVPDQKYSVMVDMPSSEFRKVITDLTQFGDSVTIEAIKGQITFETSGENGSNKVEFKSNEELSSIADEDEAKDEDRGVQITVTEKVKLGFSIKYLAQFAKASQLSARTRLSMTNKVPIVVEYQIEDDGYLKFYLAPKIDEEDDEDMD